MSEVPAIAIEPEDADGAKRQIHLGIFGRLPPLTPRQLRVFLIVTTAGFFDNYDRALLSLALKQIQNTFRVAEAGIGAMLSTIRLGYLMTLLITPFADVFGRRRLLLYTVVAYTLFTALSAIAPTSAGFILCQVLARAFAGAEAAVAIVILAEEVDASVRGWAIGMMGALTACGYGIAALVFGLINIVPYGWRGLYAIALIPLAVIIPLRRILPESRRFERETLEGTQPKNLYAPLAALFRANPGRLVMVLSVTFLAAMGGTAGGLLFPKYLQEVHHWSPGQVASLFVTGGAIGIMGGIVSGRLSDRFGRRTMGALFSFLAAALVIWIYASRGASVVPAWIAQLFFDSASGTILNTYGAELFPTSYRSTAQSAQTVAGTTGGALGLFLESLLYRATGSHWTAICYLTAFWMAVPVIMLALFPETAGRELEAISPDAPLMSASK